MKNPRLYYLLKQLGLSPQKIADDPRVMSSRAHVTECLLNKPGRGKNTRKRIVGMLLDKFPAKDGAHGVTRPTVRVQSEHDVVLEILRLLGWDEKGNLIAPAVPRGEPQLERSETISA